MNDSTSSNFINRWTVWIAAITVIAIAVVLYVEAKPNQLAPGAIVDFSDGGFLPNAVSVKLGADVQWHNSSSSVRKLTTTSKDLNSGKPMEISISPYDTYTIRFSKPGTYIFYDGINPNSNGEVIVGP